MGKDVGRRRSARPCFENAGEVAAAAAAIATARCTLKPASGCSVTARAVGTGRSNADRARHVRTPSAHAGALNLRDRDLLTTACFLLAPPLALLEQRRRLLTHRLRRLLRRQPRHRRLDDVARGEAQTPEGCLGRPDHGRLLRRRTRVAAPVSLQPKGEVDQPLDLCLTLGAEGEPALG